MGTRGLTAVMVGGEYKIAQYGQWDHNPAGQGATALAFCRELLHKKTEAAFRKQLRRCRWATDAEMARVSGIEAFLFARDHGAKILSLVLEAKTKEIVLQDSITFSGESLHCEQGYVIDLDKMAFEVYEGFNKVPLDQSERFSGFDQPGEYRPIKLAAAWRLTDKKLGRMPAKAQDTALRLGYRVLPTEEEFIRQLTPKDEDE